MGMAASQARLMSLTARLSDLEFRAQAIMNDKIRLSDMGTQASQKYSDALDKQVMKVYSTDKSAYAQASVNNLVSYSKPLNLDSTNSKYRYMETASGKLVATPDLFTKLGITADASGNYAKPTEAQLNTYLHTMVPFDSPAAPATPTSYSENTLASQQYKYYSDLCQKLGDGNFEVLTEKNAKSAEYLTQQIELGNVYLVEYVADGGDTGTGKFNNVSWDSGDASIDMDSDQSSYARAEAEYETTMSAIESKDKRFDLELTAINTEHKAIETEIDSVKKVIDKNIERSFKTFNG